MKQLEMMPRSEDEDEQYARNSTLTAKARKGMSTPIRTLLSVIRPGQWSVLDFGCGLGADVLALRSHVAGLQVDGYDPGTRSPPEYQERPRRTYDLVTMVYVLNALPPKKREMPMTQAWEHVAPGGHLFVATRTPSQVNSAARNWREWADGFVTNLETFQRGFTSAALKEMGLGLFDGVRSAHEIPATAFGGVLFVREPAPG